MEFSKFIFHTVKKKEKKRLEVPLCIFPFNYDVFSAIWQRIKQAQQEQDNQRFTAVGAHEMHVSKYMVIEAVEGQIIFLFGRILPPSSPLKYNVSDL